MSVSGSYQQKLTRRQARARKDRPAGLVFTAVFLFTLFAYQAWAGLWWPAAAGAALATGWTAAMITLAVRETLPLPVPPELAADYAKLQHDGWRRARVNPWWSCREKLPHTHLVHAADQCPLVLTWHGRHVNT